MNDPYTHTFSDRMFFENFFVFRSIFLFGLYEKSRPNLAYFLKALRFTGSEAFFVKALLHSVDV